MAHEKFSQVADFIGCTGTTGRTEGQHLTVSFLPGTIEFVIGQGRNDDARADGIDRRAPLSPVIGFGHDPQDVAAF